MKVAQFLEVSAIMVSVLVFSPTRGQAASWQQAWSAQASAEYDSNPAMAPAYPVDIWRSIFEPGYKLKGTDGVNELNMGVALQITRASNKMISPNREDSRGFFDWRQRSNTDEFGISGAYDEVATRTTTIDNTGPGLADSTRTSRLLSANENQALTERSTLALDGAYEQVFYKGGTFVNYVTRSAGMKFSYAWNERNTPFLRISYTDYKPTNDGALSRLNNVLIGWNWKISEYLECTIQAGKSRMDNVQGKQGGVNVQYTDQRTLVAINADRQVSPSGFGGFVTVDQAKGSWSYALNESSKTGVDLEWQKNHLSMNVVNNTAGAWLQQDINSSWGTRMYYLHKISMGGGARAYSNILGVSLMYTPSDF
ncbi:MAG: hypothetical protein ABI536_02705 [Gallionella sp.]